jgi:hypothetical protein
LGSFAICKAQATFVARILLKNICYFLIFSGTLADVKFSHFNVNNKKCLRFQAAELKKKTKKRKKKEKKKRKKERKYIDATYKKPNFYIMM